MAESTPERVVVLVIEDDPNVRELFVDTLTEEGYHVVATATGAEALTLMSTVWPDLITLDLDLPDTTGQSVLEKIRQDYSRPLPVVIVSAKHRIPQEIRALAQAVLPKPFDIDHLIALIRDLLPPPQQHEK